MTPKEKAEEIVNRFYKYANSTDFNHLTGDFYTNNLLWLNNAKQCALICVDEILKSNPVSESNGIYVRQNLFWEEVKQEIEKL